MGSLCDKCDNYKLYRGNQFSADNLPKGVRQRVLGGFAPEYQRFIRNALPAEIADYTRNGLSFNGTLKVGGVSDKPFFVTDEDMGINGAMGNSFALVRPGVKGSKLRIIMAHTDTPCLKTRPQPIYVEVDAEKEQLSRNVALLCEPFGGVRPADWYGKGVVVTGRIYDGSTGLARKVEIPARIEQRSLHTEEDGEVKTFEHLRAYTPARTIKELYGLLGVRDSLDFSGADLGVFPENIRTTNGHVVGDELIGFGHDDRSCLFAGIRAFENALQSRRNNTLMVFGLEREEVGSTGNGGGYRGFFESVLKETLKIVEGRHAKEIDLPLDLNRGLLGDLPAISADVDIGLSDQELADWQNVDYLNAAKLGWGFFISAFDNDWAVRRCSRKHTARLMDLMRTRLPGTHKSDRVQVVGSVHAPGSPSCSGTMADVFDSYLPTVDMGVPVSGLHTPGGENLNLFDLYWLSQGYQVYLEA